MYTMLSKLFLALDFVGNSRATCLLIYSGIRCNAYLHCSKPLQHFVSGIERLHARSKLPRIPPYSALDIFLSFNSRVTSATLPDVIDQIVKPAEVHSLGIPTLYPFVSTMEPRRKDDKLHHDDPKERTEDINVMGRPLREELL